MHSSREYQCPECGGPTREWLTFCDRCAPDYADDDNQGHASELEDDCA